MHCNRFLNPPISRREMLLGCANGFGALALAALMKDGAYGEALTNVGAARQRSAALGRRISRPRPRA